MGQFKAKQIRFKSQVAMPVDNCSKIMAFIAFKL
jgi:hypothetical protein